MSANVDSIGYVGQTPWHGLGTSLPEDPDTLSVLKLSGLDWEVQTLPARAKHNGQHLEVPNTRIVTRMDTMQPFGAVSDSYQPIQNRELFGVADTVASETPARYVTAGALGQGQEVWVLLKFPEPMDIEGDPHGDIDRYFLIRSSHDGSHALETRFTPVRVVCQNTMNLAVAGSKTSFSIRHTESAQQKIQRVRNSLRAAAQYYDSLQEVLTAWVRRPLDLDTFIDEVAEELFPTDEEGERSSKAQADYDRLLNLYEGGLGMSSAIRGTKYGALQAVTEYADHAKTFRSSNTFDQQEARMRSIVDGSARRFKQKAYRLIDRAA